MHFSVLGHLEQSFKKQKDLSCNIFHIVLFLVSFLETTLFYQKNKQKISCK